MLKVYGLKTCDTCRKATRWLDERGTAYDYVDVRADGVPAARLEAWVSAVGWETLLNRRSTTWRELADADKADVDAGKAVALMSAHPTLIKRPVFVTEAALFVGFDDTVRKALS